MENHLADYFAFWEFMRDNEVFIHLWNSYRIHYQEEKGVRWLLLDGDRVVKDDVKNFNYLFCSSHSLLCKTNMKAY